MGSLLMCQGWFARLLPSSGWRLNDSFPWEVEFRAGGGPIEDEEDEA